ncbi:MAG TPA: DMT family transporter [Burkholderiales bacterium]|nr:DMT family transporter [Burkholderiales bacterium]
MVLADQAPIVRATLWMFGAIVSFSTMAIAGRELSSELTTFQILFYRSLAGFVLMVMLLSRSGWWQLKTRHFGTHLIRNLAHYGGQYGWFYGIALIPLAEVFAIEFTMPIWTAILAALMLGERISRRRALAIAIGFAGVLVMLRPGIAAVSPAALAVLAAAFLYGFAHTLTKRLSGTDTPMAILFYTTAVQLPLALLPALHDWTWPSLAAWPWVVGVGAAALSAHYCLTRAFILEDAAVVMPIDFLRLPFIAVIGYIFYDEPLEFWVFVGATIVFAGSWLNLRAGPGNRRSPEKPKAG